MLLLAALMISTWICTFFYFYMITKGHMTVWFMMSTSCVLWRCWQILPLCSRFLLDTGIILLKPFFRGFMTPLFRREGRLKYNMILFFFVHFHTQLSSSCEMIVGCLLRHFWPIQVLWKHSLVCRHNKCKMLRDETVAPVSAVMN